jgi:hypothetical protein
MRSIPSTDVGQDVNSVKVGQPGQPDRAKRRLYRDIEASIPKDED